jgi:hypothetical protein
MLRNALLATLLLLPMMSLAGSTCPTNFATGYGGCCSFDYQSSAPSWDQAIFGGHVSYDLVAGTFGGTGGGGGGEQSGGISLRFSDQYQILGPASAIPIPFEVAYHVTGNLSANSQTYPQIGTVCNSSRVTITATSGAASASFTQSSFAQDCVPVGVDHDFTLTLAYLPGQSFVVTTNLSVSGSDVGDIDGTFAIIGLPPGYMIESCQGYAGPPVPALARSWGHLKHAYR